MTKQQLLELKPGVYSVKIDDNTHDLHVLATNYGNKYQIHSHNEIVYAVIGEKCIEIWRIVAGFLLNNEIFYNQIDILSTIDTNDKATN